jgi:molybdopterin converting factor small subunit
LVEVRLDAMLREFLPRQRVSVDASTVEAVLVRLEEEYPRLKFRLRDETGTLRRFIRVFVNEDDIRTLRGMETPVGAQDTVHILHSIQGG